MDARSPHIPFSRLADLAEGRLLPEERAGLQSHLDGCSQCAADLGWLTRAIDLLAGESDEEPPATVVARAVRLFQSARPASAGGLRQRLMALLSFDSAQSQLALGVRSGQIVGTRQLIFHTDAGDLDVRLQPVGAAWVVVGQVLGQVTGGQVELSGPTSLQAPLNELGEFSLPPVPAGTYTLLVRYGEIEIILPPIAIGA